MLEKILQQRTELQGPFENLLMHNALKHVSDGVIFVGLDGKLAFVNESATKSLKILKTGLFWDHFADDVFGFSMREALKFGISHKRLYRKVQEKELEISTFFIYEGPKSAHGLLIFFRDITEKQNLLSLINRQDQVQKLGEMVASITHEIRNPLGGIRGYASLLYRDLENDKNLQEMAGLILDATKALERLIGSILQYARPLQLTFQSVEMGQFIRNILKFTRIDPACPDKIQWEIHIPEDPFFAPIDPVYLKSVLLNLIFNAFQAMPQGGRLTVSLLKEGGCTKIAISDTGVGMSEEQMGKLFSPFFTTKEMGNGLGLVEVKKIVQAHFGSIDVRSSLKKGTTFTLTLPLRR